MSLREISIADIGPITQFRFPVPEDGGVVELLGANGAGKSRALEALNALATGNNGNVEHRDGVVAGTVEAFGATLKISRRVTRSGELEVQSIESRFSVADLVDPKIKSPDAADAKRIKALVQLAGGAGADPSLFYQLLGGQENSQELVSTRATATDDLVTLAARIKRDLEDKAREVEEDATKANIAAESDRQAALGLDLNALDDADKLAADLELTIQEESALKANARAALAARSRSEEAGRALTAAADSYTGIGVGAAGANVELALQKVSDCDRAVKDAEAALLRARDAQTEARHAHEMAVKAKETAEAHESAIAQWRATLAKELPPSVTDEDLAIAADDVRAAREAMERGTLVREAKRRVAQADRHAQRAADMRTRADRLRAAAKGTDDVLSDVVGKLGCPLSVSHGRLVTPTERSQTELFSDLSRGEQWTLALRIAVKAVGRGGLLVIDQEGWEGIDPTHKAQIANELQGSGVVLITAHCDVGELRARTLGNGNGHV